MYFNDPEHVAINRPLLSWDRPLADAGWRRWFDTLKEQGVDRIGPMRQSRAMTSFEPFKQRNNANELAMRDAIYRVSKRPV